MMVVFTQKQLMLCDKNNSIVILSMRKVFVMATEHYYILFTVDRHRLEIPLLQKLYLKIISYDYQFVINKIFVIIAVLKDLIIYYHPSGVLVIDLSLYLCNAAEQVFLFAKVVKRDCSAFEFDFVIFLLISYLLF